MEKGFFVHLKMLGFLSDLWASFVPLEYKLERKEKKSDPLIQK